MKKLSELWPDVYDGYLRNEYIDYIDFLRSRYFPSNTVGPSSADVEITNMPTNIKLLLYDQAKADCDSDVRCTGFSINDPRAIGRSHNHYSYITYKVELNNGVVSRPAEYHFEGSSVLSFKKLLRDDNRCQPSICAENEYVSNHTCVPCPAGKTNAAGDTTIMSNTESECVARMCGPNQYVDELRNCQTCPNGTYRLGDDDASVAVTTCNAILCDENEYVKESTDSEGVPTKICEACPPGTYNGPGDPLDGSKGSTCNAILCEGGWCRKS